jgi:hypothetical protein
MKTIMKSAIAMAIITATAGAAFARAPDRGEYYQGTERQATIRTTNQGSSIDRFATGSISNHQDSGKAHHFIKGGEGEYYRGIQRN